MPLKIAKILFPTDFSEFSLAALPYARELASIFDGQIHCLHVVDEAYQYWTGMGPEAAPLGPSVDELLGLAEGQMQRFHDEHLMGLKYVPITAVVIGRPFKEIVHFARERLIDMIVMATHGRGGLAHVLLGSTADKVVHNAPCPVLTLRGRGVDAPAS